MTLGPVYSQALDSSIQVRRFCWNFFPASTTTMRLMMATLLCELFLTQCCISTHKNRLYGFSKFNHSDRCKIVAETLPAFTLCDSLLLFVNKFKYLGHIIDHFFSRYSDINREIRTLFTRANVLCERFKRCSLAVKVRFFVPSVCFYYAALWTDFTTGVFNRLASCYRYSKY